MVWLGISQADILHAIANAMHEDFNYNDSRVGRGKAVLWVSKPVCRIKLFLEIMGTVTPLRDVFIFHAMEVRHKILKRIKK